MRSEPDERGRDMYRLRTVEGLTLRQIAERFQVSPERVRQLVYAYARATGCQRSPVAISRAASAARRMKDLARAESLAGELLAAWRDGAEPEQIAKAFGLRCRSVAEVLKRHKTVDDRAARAAALLLLRGESASESRRSG